MHVNDLAFERNKNNLKTKNIFFPIFRVDHVRLSNEYFFASCALEQQYTYVLLTKRFVKPVKPQVSITGDDNSTYYGACGHF